MDRRSAELLVASESRSETGARSVAAADIERVGHPALALGAGVVVAAVDGVPDHPAGELPPVSAWGNHVVIDHGTGELALLAHLQQGSVSVHQGQRVALHAPVRAVEGVRPHPAPEAAVTAGARRLLLAGSPGAEAVAYGVRYVSASQFSRGAHDCSVSRRGAMRIAMCTDAANGQPATRLVAASRRRESNGHIRPRGFVAAGVQAARRLLRPSVPHGSAHAVRR